MDKPKDALERMRQGRLAMAYGDEARILAWADSVPDVCVEWPKELTRERLEELAKGAVYKSNSDALRALAAIAPERKKRVVNLWRFKRERALEPMALDWYPVKSTGADWECVARNVELED